MHFTIVIPARYASTRLPGKPLLAIAGKPMLEHVHAHALASGAARVIIATDDERIRTAALGFGAEVRMTSPAHASGTERIAEVVAILKEPDHGIVVNVQGDEPLLPPGLMRQVARDLSDHPGGDVATLCERITDGETLFDPAVVKVVMDWKGDALYFSRAPIPWDRDHFATRPDALPPEGAHGPVYHRHIGIYAYRAAFLRDYAARPHCPLEKVEALEQLRVLYDGGKIHVGKAVEPPGFGVDTPADLMRARRAFETDSL
uniref:3-deoxy-manno-octulosonate cytidylyltransferase n=1 Tax=Candidatus Kentrum eta TaxID=2126337 RepID=A0A450V2G2_9GAMM|nr:MAG: 3-deoxy-manno-octulosonate cytidylyltransferase (CMP-KDO synthetase) [Candidatus Kentron sp. H]VFJ92398.1 MAG: 3-deoxy-manno-octulosonate cytidylyltransferase (CMP-KDO synthetase) [Candidatus Kentron sp. H]VFJ98988.1 MAG: 3-deoxy-manno-octulosonate cytidylyltransferase (CMP-KDO synthetase) [Candidatus Kentron sp. H]